MKCLICDAEFYHNQLKFHLRKEHNIDVAEYYLKYVLETDEVPKCIYCGGDSKFLKFSRGYSVYCSKNCRSKHNIGILNKNPEIKRLYRKNLVNQFNKNKPLSLYVLDLVNCIKVGVTQSSQLCRSIIPERLYRVCLDANKLGYSNLKLIQYIKGSFEEVINIEDSIVEIFSEKSVDGAEGVEYFKKEALEDILKFINDNISSSTTIETLDVEEINKALQPKK